MIDLRLYADPRDHPDNVNIPLVNQPQTILGVTVAFLTIALLAIALRLWVRVRNRLWGWDDLFVLLSGIGSGVGDGMVCTMPDRGLGLHMWTFDGSHITSFYKHIYMTNTIYCGSATFIKLAILFQYLRLFAESTISANTPRYRLARRLTILMIIISSLWGLVFFLLAVASCHPISKNWNPTIAGKCIGWGTKDPVKFFAFFASHSATNMALDILIFFLPVPFLSMLRLGGESRKGLYSLFVLGAVVVAVSTGRFVVLCINRAGTFPVLDVPYHTPIIYLFSILEVNLAILCASIPTFWPIFQAMALNKITVVNEVIVRVEENPKNSFSSSQGIRLDSWSKDDTPPIDDSLGTRTKRLNALPKAASKSFDRSSLPRVLQRPFSKESWIRGEGYSSSSHHHNHSASSSIGRAMGMDVKVARPSQESQRHLHPMGSGEMNFNSKGSLGTNGTGAWLDELDRQQGTKTTTIVEKGV